MRTVERIFRLEGPKGLGARPHPGLVGDLMVQLPDTLRDAVRMGFLHSSRAEGRLSNALKAASEVRFVDVSSDSDDVTNVRFELPVFGEAAPELFAQGQLWDRGPKPEGSAFDLLGDALVDIGAGRVDSDHFDQALLGRIAHYGRLFKHGLTRIALNGDGGGMIAQVSPAVVESAHMLSRRTPTPRRVRVTGRLDLMGASQGILKLHLRPGEIVTALWAGPKNLEEFKDSFNRDVVVEGLGVFRPSGTLLRIEAEALLPATSQDEFFRQLPEGIIERDYSQAVRLRAGEPSVYARILGSIPAEESDEEFAAAVEAMS